MKILVIAESLRINETSSGIVTSTFLKALSENKDNEIVCLYDKVFDYDITWLAGIRVIKLKKRSYKKSLIIDRIPKLRGLTTYLIGIHAKSKHKIKDWKYEINKTLNKEKFDIIISLGSGSEFYPYYAMLGIDTKTPWLANFHDPFPMSVYPEPYKQKRNWINKNQEKISQKIIKRASFVSFPSLYLKDLMQEKYLFSNEKSIILPHVGIRLHNLPNAVLDSKVHLDISKFNILHAGTLLGPRKVEALFKAFNLFLEENTERQESAVLNILGKVAKEHQKIKEIITKYPSNFNVITDRVSYKKSLELTKLADVSLIIEADAKFSPFMPGKLADLIYLEKPILALTPKKSETIRILGEHYPYQAVVNDVEEIYSNLVLLWNNWKNNNLELTDIIRLKNYISAEELNKKINTLRKC